MQPGSLARIFGQVVRGSPLLLAVALLLLLLLALLLLLLLEGLGLRGRLLSDLRRGSFAGHAWKSKIRSKTLVSFSNLDDLFLTS